MLVVGVSMKMEEEVGRMVFFLFFLCCGSKLSVLTHPSPMMRFR